MIYDAIADDYPSDYAQTLIEYLGCPCTYFEPMADDGPILRAYNEAKTNAQDEGYVPVLIVVDGTLLESFQFNVDPPAPGVVWGPIVFNKENIEAYRKEHLERSLLDGKDVLANKLDKAIACAQDNGKDWQFDIVGDMEEGYENNLFNSYWDSEHLLTEEVVLAKIPVKYPWQIFAYLPFGNFNECPDTPELMAVAKYWYEKYGATPAVMTHDVLEFELPQAVDKKLAMTLASEQYVFCNDVVDQGVGTVGHLADILWRSKVWYFWWD